MTKNKEVQELIEGILSMSEDTGREGCFYGDTEFDSLSAAHGYNTCLNQIQNKIREKLSCSEALPDATDFYKDDFNAFTDRILRDKGASNKDIYDANNEAFKELKENYLIVKIN